MVALSIRRCARCSISISDDNVRVTCLRAAKMRALRSARYERARCYACDLRHCFCWLNIIHHRHATRYVYHVAAAAFAFHDIFRQMLMLFTPLICHTLLLITTPAIFTTPPCWLFRCRRCALMNCLPGGLIFRAAFAAATGSPRRGHCCPPALRLRFKTRQHKQVRRHCLPAAATPCCIAAACATRLLPFADFLR